MAGDPAGVARRRRVTLGGAGRTGRTDGPDLSPGTRRCAAGAGRPGPSDIEGPVLADRDGIHLGRACARQSSLRGRFPKCDPILRRGGSRCPLARDEGGIGVQDGEVTMSVHGSTASGNPVNDAMVVEATFRCELLTSGPAPRRSLAELSASTSELGSGLEQIETVIPAGMPSRWKCPIWSRRSVRSSLRRPDAYVLQGLLRGGRL